MAFLDEDELAPAGAPGPRTSGPDHQRQILVRRLVALAAGVLVLILILLGIRGCLNARKERGFENYVSDLESVVTQSNQLSQGFFGRLENPPKGVTELSLEADVAADRGNAEGLLQRVEGLDTPDELEGAQSNVILAFELRRDALAGIADAIPTALGTEGSAEAVDRIATEMTTFLASDVLYRRAAGEIETVLSEEEIEGKVLPSQFLPDPVESWLDELELFSTLSTVASDTGAVTGVHGLELLSTTLNPGGNVLTDGGEATISLDDPPEIDADVQNGGDSEERDVVVAFQLTGAGVDIEDETTIPQIGAGEIQTATLGLGDPPPGTPLTLEVTVRPVLGEQFPENNAATYTVTFEG